MKTLKIILPFFIFFSFTVQGFAQDLSFTQTKAKAVGEEVRYQVELKEQQLLNNLQQGRQLELQLDGQRFLQTIKRKKALSFGYTGITGHPIDGNSYSNLMIKDGKITGVLHFDGKPYRLSNKDGAYEFFEITEEVHQCSLDEVVAANTSFQKSTTPGGENAIPSYDLEDYSDTTTVDVLVLYTTNAKNWASGLNNSVTNDIEEIFALNESFKNDIIENSELPLKIRFLDFIEIDNATATSTSDKLGNMQDNSYSGSTHTSDTVDIHSLREQFGADLVALVDSIEDTGGLGYRINGIGGGESSGFSVNRVQQMSFNNVLMHEIGHNFGNAHGRTQSSNAATDKGGIFQFSTGHYFQASDGEKYNTVMDYGDSNSTDIPYYSNPRVMYQDSATGSYAGVGGPSDNVLSMSITKNWIADYKETVVDPAQISLSTTAVEDTVYPSGVSTRNIIIENTGDSDLEVKLDGEMEFSSSLKMAKTIKQPLSISYGFEESEGFETGSYTGYNNWISSDDEVYEITSTQAALGTQSLKAPSSSHPYIQSPYFSTSSRYSSYTISMKVYSDGGPARAFLEFSSADTENEAAGILLQETGKVGFYGMNGSKSYWTSSSDLQVSDQWVDVNITISTVDGGTISYEYGNSVSRSFTGNGFYFPEIFYLVLQSSSSNSVYIDDIEIAAEDLYGPALTIDDSHMTIRPGETDTMTVTFYGNGYDEGIYDGNIYLETNDPNNNSMTIPVDLYIDPNNLHSNDEFAIELTGQEGFRLLSAPTSLNLQEFLDPLHTQGMANADVTNGEPNVWTWNKSFSGSSNSGWVPVSNLDTTLSAGDAFLIYAFNESVYGDTTSRGFPKLLPVTGTPASTATPDVNQNANGLTLVGNPYPSTIDWDNVSTTELQNAVYVYDPNAESWQSYVNGTGDITNGLIKPFQGFFVQSSSSISSGPDISFETNDIASGGEFYGKPTTKQFIRFEVKDTDRSLTNSSYVVFDEFADSEKDDLDAIELFPLSPEYLFVSTESSDGVDLDINSLPDFEQTLSLPLDISSNVSQTISFTLTDMSNLENTEIFLIKGDWQQEVLLNETIQFAIEPMIANQVNGFPSLLKKQDTNEYELVFQKKSIVSIEEPNVPQEFKLLQNYPNPFNPSTSIQFGLPTSVNVKLSVFNVLGQLVEVLVNKPLQAGFHTVNFNAEDLSSGVYLFRIEAGAFIQTKKMVLLK